ncbi:MAG: TatD family hydrolase [Arenicella sp.]
MLIDSHCHINFKPLAENIDSVLKNARDNNISNMLCVSVNMEDFPQVLALAQNHEHIFASVGVHPCEREGREPEVDELIEIGSKSEIIAIGETGLDYFRVEDDDMSWQHQRFINHITAAKSVNKPLIIHTRNAASDTMRMLKEQGADECRGVMHCFAEDWEVAKKALDLGFYISFSGIVTFKSATNVQEVAQKAPADRILVETDAPYLAPVPHRGKTNEPALVKHTAEFVADLRGVPLEELAKTTSDNFFTLFDSAA